jgi:type II secretory pathway component PulK
MRRSNSKRGSAIILVLWCLVVLGIAIFGVVELVELSAENTSRDELALQARALAMSGVALGLSPQISKDDPLLAQQPADNRSFKVRIESEGSRLNLNYVLLSGHREILENLFTQWGLPPDQADHVADCLYDWITPGDLKSVDGAKADDYAHAGLSQRPSYRPFASLDEAREAMGMDEVEKARPDWRDSFTLWSAGPLDVAEAPPELIAAVFSLDPRRVQIFTAARNGRDGIAGTADDVPIQSLAAFGTSLGISAENMKILGGQIELGDPQRRIESIGQAQGVRVMISVVARLNSSPVQYLLWSEP